MAYDRLATQEDFNKIHAFTAYWERDFGDFTDSKWDRGGVTRNGVTVGFLKGISDKTLADLNKDGKIDVNDVKLVTPEVAKKLFHREFWEGGRAYCCPRLTAMAYYDFSVNSGSGNAAMCLQKAIDTLRPGTIIAYAKNLGPKTREALKKFTDKQDDFDLAIEVCRKREAFVRAIADNDLSQKNNLKGWLNRISGLQKMLQETFSYA